MGRHVGCEESPCSANANCQSSLLVVKEMCYFFLSTILEGLHNIKNLAIQQYTFHVAFPTFHAAVAKFLKRSRDTG